MTATTPSSRSSLASLTAQPPSLLQRLMAVVGIVPPGVSAEDRESLLENSERFMLATRLTLSLASACLLVVAVGIRFIFPAQKGLSDLVAGAAAALVAPPVLAAETCDAVKLGARKCSSALLPPIAAGMPTKPATNAPTARTWSGKVMGDGDSCGPCHAP